MPTFGRNVIAGAVNNQEVEDTLVACEATFPNLTNQKAISISVFHYTVGDPHKMKAALYEGDSPYALIASTPEESVPATSGAWYTFTFSSPVNLVANKKYRITVWSEGIFFSNKAKYNDEGEPERMIHKAEVYAESFPDPFPANPTINVAEPVIYCTYSAAQGDYPADRLKKGLITGFNCFLNAYLLARLGEFNPLKLPDGTPF